MPIVPRARRALPVIIALAAALLAQAARAADRPGDEAVEQKLGSFIDCINNSDTALQRTFPGYRRLLAEINKDSNTGHTAFMGGFEHDDSGHKKSLECADGLESAAKAAPEIEDLDRLAIAYATAIRAFVPLALRADAYYDQGDYKDDKWAKGRDLDEKLAPLIAQLEELSAGIHKGVTRELAGIRERELAAVEAKEGKGANWHALNYMLAARGTLDAFRDGAPEALAPAIERLQKGYDDGEAYAAAHQDEAIPPGPGGPRGWFKVRLSARLFLTEVKDMNRKLRPEAKSLPAELDREFDLIVQRYNQLVNDYNNG